MMASVREKLLEREPVLPVDEIQGDILLGFNKPHSQIVVIDIDESQITKVKLWLISVADNITTAADVLAHRREYREIGYDKYDGPAFVQVAFGYPGLKKLTANTEFEASLQSLSFLSPFVIGAANRATFIGDNLGEWDFNSNRSVRTNNDITMTVSADKRDCVDAMLRKLLNDVQGIKVVSSMAGFRGERSDLLYGHEVSCTFPCHCER